MLSKVRSCYTTDFVSRAPRCDLEVHMKLSQAKQSISAWIAAWVTGQPIHWTGQSCWRQLRLQWKLLGRSRAKAENAACTSVQ